MQAYQSLENRFKRLAHLEHASQILEWDEATMMPEGSAPQRAEASATLEVLKHEILTDPHTPGAWRPYVARNHDAWYKAFGVKPGQKYYLAPDQRIKVW